MLERQPHRNFSLAELPSRIATAGPLFFRPRSRLGRLLSGYTAPIGSVDGIENAKSLTRRIVVAHDGRDFRGPGLQLLKRDREITSEVIGMYARLATAFIKIRLSKLGWIFQRRKREKMSAFKFAFNYSAASPPPSSRGRE